MENIDSVPAKKQKMDVDLEFRGLLLDNLKSLYDSEILSNVTLIAGLNGQRISAHRVILAAATPFFRAMFTNNLKEKNQSEITLQEIDGDSLRVLINFCYSGLIDINETNAYRILDTASRLEFTHIEAKCQTFLMDHLNLSNCLSVYVSVQKFLNFNELAQLAMQLVKQNFEEVVEQQAFLQLEAKHLLELLKSDDLNVWSEEEVFNALSKWINYDEKTRKRHAKELLATIRLTELKSQFLYKTVGDFCKKFKCANLIKEVYQWKNVPESRPQPILARPSTTANHFIAIGNGFQSTLENLCSEIFDPILNNWRAYKKFTCERVGFGTAVVDDELFIIGGWCAGNIFPVNSVEKYNFSTKETTGVHPMHEARTWFATAVLNNEIYIAGGSNMNLAEKFNTKTNQWTRIKSMIQKRNHFALIPLNGKLYAIGGYDEQETYLNSVECYNPFKKRWTLKAAMKYKRSGHAACVHNERLYVFGGISGVFNMHIEYYDPIIDQWTVIETLIVSINNCGLVSFKDFVIIAGGSSFRNTCLSSVYKINLKDLSSEQLAPMKTGRTHLALIQMPRYQINA